MEECLSVNGVQVWESASEVESLHKEFDEARSDTRFQHGLNFVVVAIG